MTLGRSMRIFYFILDGFPTFRPDISALWGKWLVREGIESDLVTVANPAEGPAHFWPGGSTFVCARARNRVVDQFRSFFHDVYMLLRARRRDYDAIQVRDKSFICIPALLYARAMGIPFFYWMSFPIAESVARLASRISWRRQFLRWVFLWWRGNVGAFVLYKWVLPRADHIFVQSHKMMSDLGGKGLDARKMTAVPMCIDPDRYPDALTRTVSGDLGGRPVVGYLGECSRIRRVDFLLEAVAVVRESVPDVFFMIVGDAIEAEDQAWLRLRVSELGLDDNVRITGWVNPEEVSSLFSCVDVGLALMAPDPILDSTTPTKLVEYLAMGLPVVANDHPDQTQVIERSGAGLVAAFETSAFADAITKLLSAPDIRNVMAQSGRQWVLNERSYPEMGRRLAGVYRRLIDGGGASSS